MSAVTIYTSTYCPYCVKAKQLLGRKNVDYKEINIEKNPEFVEECKSRSNRTTVPQIFIGETHVGGCDELHALEGKGKLDELLAGLN